MTEQEYRCPHCGRYLGRATLVDDSTVIITNKCKGCRKPVDVVVKRKETVGSH